jgi:hypothetical protein
MRRRPSPASRMLLTTLRGLHPPVRIMPGQMTFRRRAENSGRDRRSNSSLIPPAANPVKTPLAAPADCSPEPSTATVAAMNRHGALLRNSHRDVQNGTDSAFLPVHDEMEMPPAAHRCPLLTAPVSLRTARMSNLTRNELQRDHRS